jgi:hypothetical protein
LSSSHHGGAPSIDPATEVDVLAQERVQGEGATISVVICMEHGEDVLDKANEGERLEDEDVEDVSGARVRLSVLAW